MNQPSNPLLNQQPQYHQPQQFGQQQAPVMTIGDWIVTSIVLAIPLVNLIMDAPVVTELIQGDLNTRNLKVELDKLLDPAYRDKLQRDYQVLRERLGNEGASRRTAQAIYNSLQDKRHNDRS